MHKQYIVRLSDEARRPLAERTRKGKAAAYKIRHAELLVKADADGPAWTDAKIAESFSVSVNTVLGVRQRWVEQGLEAALTRKKQDRPSRPPLLDGAGEAKLIALRCSEPPAGHARRTLRLWADQAVAVEIVEAISHETVRQPLKKPRGNRICARCGAFRPSTRVSLSRIGKLSWRSTIGRMIRRSQ